MDKKRVGLLVLGGVCLVGVVAFAAAWMALKIQSGLAANLPFKTATVVQRVQSMAELVTVKYVIEKIVILEDPQYLGGMIPLGQNRIILLAHGQVKAGVDLSQLKSGDVSISGRKIVVTLPKVALTDAYLVEPRTQILDYTTGLLTPFNKTLEQTARRQALMEITRAARQSGIEQEAAEQARKQMVRFLQTLGFTDVEVRPHNN